jgi:signal transduction histidine kinase
MSNSGNQSGPDPSRTRSFDIRAFPLGFRDPDVENGYREKWLKATRRDHIMWTVGSIVGYALICALLWFATQPGFLTFQWFRMFVALPLLFAAMVLVLRGRFSERVYFLLFVAKTVAIYGNAIVSYALADGPDVRLYLFESALIFVFVQYFYPVRWALTTTFTLIGTAVATAAIIHADTGPAGQIVPLEMVLLVTYGLAGTCNFSAYSKEVFSRRNFSQLTLLKQRERELQDLAETVSKAADSKARFLAIAAHELRTPLNAMHGFAQLGQMNRGLAVCQNSMLERFKAIERDSSHLIQLAESTLAISKDGGASLAGNRQFFQIEALLQLAAKEFSANTSNAKVRPHEQMAAKQHIIIGDPGIYRTLIDCLIQRARAETGRKKDTLVDFRRLTSGQFGLFAWSDPKVAALFPDNAGELVLPDGQESNHSSVSSASGLLNMLAASQSAEFGTAETASTGTVFWLKIPAELVSPAAAALLQETSSAGVAS